MKKKLSRRNRGRMENVLIVLLFCSALFLMGKAGLFEGFQEILGLGQNTASNSDGQSMALSQETPVRLVIQTQAGRYGVQYDQKTVDGLYGGGLDLLLAGALSSVTEVQAVSQEKWQQVISEEGHWIYYDFLYDIPFSTADTRSDGQARCFLVTERAGTINALYYYDAANDGYYAGVASWSEAASIRSQLEALSPNGAQFAFEAPDAYGGLSPMVLVLPQPPQCALYTVSNPLSHMDEGEENRLLEDLAINTQADTVYESADGLVVREGSDTLRILKNGTVTFHSAESGQPRYQTDASGERAQRSAAAELLRAVLAERSGEARMICESSKTTEDGNTELLFSYLLDGGQVQLYEDGWGAKFVFQGGNLLSFEIRFRQYQRQETAAPVMPERQAAAAAATMGQTGKELLVCYRDDGSGQVTAVWRLREQGR